MTSSPLQAWLFSKLLTTFLWNRRGNYKPRFSYMPCSINHCELQPTVSNQTLNNEVIYYCMPMQLLAACRTIIYRWSCGRNWEGELPSLWQQCTYLHNCKCWCAYSNMKSCAQCIYIVIFVQLICHLAHQWICQSGCHCHSNRFQ